MSNFNISRREITEYLKLSSPVFDLAFALNKGNLEGEYKQDSKGYYHFNPKAIDLMEEFLEGFDERKITLDEVSSVIGAPADQIYYALSGAALESQCLITNLVPSFKKSGSSFGTFTFKGCDSDALLNIIKDLQKNEDQTSEAPETSETSDLPEEIGDEAPDTAESTNTTDTKGDNNMSDNTVFNPSELFGLSEVAAPEPAPAPVEQASMPVEVVAPESAPVPAPAPAPAEAKTPTAPKKVRKNKYSLDKKFYTEAADPEKIDVKAVRNFFIEGKVIKLEEIAVMSDNEIINRFANEYYLLTTEKGYVFINKEWIKDNIAGIADNVFLVS